MFKTPILMALGYILLGSGLICYMVLALAGADAHPGLLPASMLLTMSSLLFFNLPAVFARRRDRIQSREKAKPPNAPP